MPSPGPCFPNSVNVLAIYVLGYANEVGEAFRSLVHVRWVRFSYVVASTYVCADAASKGSEAAEVN